jgi:hypothetical protein
MEGAFKEADYGRGMRKQQDRYKKTHQKLKK